MTDDEATVRRAQRAELLLNDDLVKDALKAIRDKALTDFKTSKPDDIDALRVARLGFDAAEQFVNIFVNHVRSGKMAEERIKRVEALKVKK